MITTVITTHGLKKHKLIPTYKSAIQHGPVIITMTGVTDQEIHIIKRHCPKAQLVTNPDNYSNAQWINGVAAIRTPYTQLVHDGDIVVSRPQTPLTADVYIGQAINLTGRPWRHTELCHPEVTSADVVRVLRKPNTKTISPGRGIFRTELLLAGLIDFENYTSPSLIVNQSLVIGNDLHIWLYAAKNINTFAALTYPIIAFEVEDSTTTRADATVYHRLERLYDLYRIYSKNKSYKQQTISLLYSPDKNLTSKVSKILCALEGTYHVYNDLVVQPAIDQKDHWGAAAWMTALGYAHDMGFDKFLYLETDCWVRLGIDTKCFESYEGPAVQYGTVTCWGLRSFGKGFYRAYLNNPDNVNIEGTSQTSPPAVYCNGALCVYDTNFHYHNFYGRGMENLSSIVPFDLHTGYTIVDIFRDEAFYRVANNPHIYSDCGDHHINPTQRRALKATHYGIHKDTHLL